MAKFYQTIQPANQIFMDQQSIFFVATALAEGRINLSPKGMDTFRVLDEKTVCFLNLTGSANETAAHLSAHNRITIMFCSFTKEPLILRLYGHGEAIHPQDAAWSTYLPHFPNLPGKRQIIVTHVDLVQSSCGYAVPFFDYQGERETLRHWSEKKGDEGIQAYWQANNRTSLDGMPIPDRLTTPEPDSETSSPSSKPQI